MLRTYLIIGLLFLFLEDKMDFDNKVESFYNPTIKKIGVTIDDISSQLFKGKIRPTDMYLEICKKFSQDYSDILFGEYLTSKYGLWIDTRSSTNNELHGNGRLINRKITLRRDKVVETSGDLMCHVFAIKDAYAYFTPVMEKAGDREAPTEKRVLEEIAD